MAVPYDQKVEINKIIYNPTPLSFCQGEAKIFEIRVKCYEMTYVHQPKMKHFGTNDHNFSFLTFLKF